MKILHKKRYAFALIAILSVAIAVVWYVNYAHKDLNAEVKEPKELGANRKITFSQLSGKIVFQSDRDGDEEIYITNPQGQGLIKLTDNKFFDGYPVWSYDGSKIAFESNREGNFQIYVMDADGKHQHQITHGPYHNRVPTWSPDGKMVAYTSKRDGSRREIYVMDLEKKKEMRLTNARYRSALPNWSPNGKKIAFTADKLHGWGIYVMNRDGSDLKALDTKGGSCRPDWSPDGSKIAYVSQEADNKGDIWIINPDGSNKQRLTTDSHNYDYCPSWSPDGKWIVYANTSHKRKGNWELRIINVGSRESKQITYHPAQDKYPDWHEN
jgi:Tol biopolymer transport system component